MNKNKKTFFEILGWYGVVAIFLAYFLLSFDFILQNSFLYQILNLTGALGIVINSLSKKDYQPTVLNIFWFLIALIAIIRIL